MDKPENSPPGKHPSDPLHTDVDPLAFAVARLQTHLKWIDEHYSSFQQLRNTDPASAERELQYLKDCSEQAVLHAHRLTKLLLAGCSVDPHKHLPKGLGGDHWLRLVESCRRHRESKFQQHH